MQKMPALGARTPRPDTQYDVKTLVAQWKTKIERANALKRIRSHEDWPAVIELLESELKMAAVANRHFNPYVTAEAYQLIFNNGVMYGIELLLNKPLELINEVDSTGGIREQFQKLIERIKGKSNE